MGKKKIRPKLNLNIKLPALTLILFLLLVLMSGLLALQQRKTKPNDLEKDKPILITDQKPAGSFKSPVPESTKTAIFVPQNYGRSVKVPILTYHYIGNNPDPADKARYNLEVEPVKFDAQMDYLAKNGFSPITFDTLYAALKGQISLPNKPIILTFDDGYLDFYVNAYPILKKYNFHAVSFIPTGLVGQSYYLNWSQIKEMDHSGLISFQAHSVTHANLTSLKPDQLKHELSESKKTLEEKLGKPVNFLAYPYGASNSLVWQITKEVGFLGAVGTWPGEVESEGIIFDLPRIKIAGEWDLTSFVNRLN